MAVGTGGVTVGLLMMGYPIAARASFPTGTVDGVLQLVGGLANFPSPIPGIVTLEGSGGTYTAEVGPSGRFSIDVAPGSYVIVGRSPQFNSGQTDCRARIAGTAGADRVEVAAGEVVHVVVECQRR